MGPAGGHCAGAATLALRTRALHANAHDGADACSAVDVSVLLADAADGAALLGCTAGRVAGGAAARAVCILCRPRAVEPLDGDCRHVDGAANVSAHAHVAGVPTGDVGKRLQHGDAAGVARLLQVCAVKEARRGELAVGSGFMTLCV